MPSLGLLRANMVLTVFAIFGVLFALLFLVHLLYPFSLYLVLALTMGIVLLQWAIAPSIIAWGTKLRYLSPGEYPWLEEEVSNLAKEAEVPMPRLAIVENPAPNAFVFGRTRASSTLAVHTGLLNALSREEVRAVLAHEVGHLRHNDVAVMTFASAIPLLAYMLFYSFLFGGRRDRDAGGMALLAMLAFAVYIVTQLLVLKLSRSREFFADAYSASSTHRPRWLARALAKITLGNAARGGSNPGTARAFYIADPQAARSNLEELRGHGAEIGVEDRLIERVLREERGRGWDIFSTHPSTYKRIRHLLELEK
ncbi:MAG: zinc metalloprotease HtpX [Candidatus Thermoplasmatota archaeon]